MAALNLGLNGKAHARLTQLTVGPLDSFTNRSDSGQTAWPDPALRVKQLGRVRHDSCSCLAIVFLCGTLRLRAFKRSVTGPRDIRNASPDGHGIQ